MVRWSSDHITMYQLVAVLTPGPLMASLAPSGPLLPALNFYILILVQSSGCPRWLTCLGMYRSHTSVQSSSGHFPTLCTANQQPLPGSVAQ